MTNATDVLRALADRVASLATDWGDMDEAERRDAIANELRALATPAGSASGEDGPVPLTEWQQLVAERDSLQAEVAQLQAALAEARRDAERLDYLDQLNAALNAYYGTSYGWELILSPNIVRLMSGAHTFGFVGDIDLNDAALGKRAHKSCRAAIDAAMGSANGQG